MCMLPTQELQKQNNKILPILLAEIMMQILPRLVHNTLL